MKNLKRPYAAVLDRPQTDDAAARFDRAHALAGAGRHAEAVDAYRALGSAGERFPWLGLNLGVSLAVLERWEETADAFAAATRALPDHPLGWSNLGSVLGKLGRLEEAIERFRRAIELAPRDVEARLNLARALQRAGRLEAEVVAAEAVRLAPESAAAWRTLGDAHVAFGANEAALAAFARVQALDPSALVREPNNPGLALLGEARLDEATALYEASIALEGENDAAWNGLGLARMHAGRVPEAIDALRRALALRPEDEAVHSNLLLNLCYSPDHTGEDLRTEAEAWARIHTSPLPSGGEGAGGEGQKLPAVHPGTTRRLRVGYLSADFHAHPAGYLYEAMFPHHDRSRFEIVAYANGVARDAVTDRIEASVDRWREVKGLGDDALVDLIQRDGIDVLVDLLGHTPNHRLKAFARRPAPVQATWLGYFGTTGLAEMDYIVADRHVLPPEHESHFTERPARMAKCLYVFQPPHLVVDPGPLPLLANGCVTFGCFNNTAKITPEVVALWCEALRALPDARMLLNRWPFASPLVRARYADLFAQNGVDPARIEFRATQGREAYFAAYRDVDVMLDTFPYGGGTTTMEALWMGVPVVTLPAERFVGRMTATILHTVGLPELLPENRADFVRLASDLATDVPRLTALRASLRPQVEASALCDLPAYTRDLETTLEWMAANPRA